MQRRSFLAGIGSSAVTAAALPSLESELVEESDESSSPDLPSDPDDPVARAVVGSASEEVPPHRIRLWNRADERQSLGLEVESDDGEVSFDGTYDLASDDHVVVVIHGRGRYDVSVSADDEPMESTELEASSFDQPCPATELVVEDDSLEVWTTSESDHC